MLNDVLRLARLGIAVFPLSVNTKLPTKGSAGVKDATTDEAKIREWWTKMPKCNVALAMGSRSKWLVGVDLDHNHGAKLEDLARFPRTVTVKTRNGFHLYFYAKRPVKNHALWGGTDNTAPAYLRSEGYYFVAPPSVVTWDDEQKKHVAPHEYSYHADLGGELAFGECPIADLPDWAYGEGDNPVAGTAQATSGNGSVGEQTSLGSEPRRDSTARASTETPGSTPIYQPGLRHNALLRTAVAMRKRGKSDDEIRKALHERNQKDFKPPKENVGPEIEGIIKWLGDNNVRPLVVFDVNKARLEWGQYLLPLGHRDEQYYYTTSSNKMIVHIGRGSHNSANLLDLMPHEFWQESWGRTNKDGSKTVNWTQAASDLMEACRWVGIYSDKNVRGAGAWEDDERIVFHTGEKLLVNGTDHELNDIPRSRYLYALRPSISEPRTDAPLTVSECKLLLEACQAAKWKHEQSSMFFAGALALARLCGALKWRPHVWLTGPAGCGKSSLLEYVAAPLVGEAGLYIVGETTSAGIRQRLECDAKPVLYDEAETNNDRSHKRMQHILELARQASSANEAQILKGTADGSGHSYKVVSQFILASIRVNLVEESDISRFAVLELEAGDPLDWPAVKQKLTAITRDYGDRLAGRMMKVWPELVKAIARFSDVVSEVSNRRTGDQYGTLLAGYWLCQSDKAPSIDEARALVSTIRLDASKVEENASDELLCVNWLLDSPCEYEYAQNKVRESLGRLLNKASSDQTLNEVLGRYGLDTDGDRLYVATQHPALKKIFHDTKWGEMYSQAIARMPGAKRDRHKFDQRRVRAVSVPLTSVYGD